MEVNLLHYNSITNKENFPSASVEKHLNPSPFFAMEKKIVCFYIHIFNPEKVVSFILKTQYFYKVDIT